MRRSARLNFTPWDAVEDYIRESNHAGKLGGNIIKSVELSEGLELYLADVSARVRASTVRLHRVLLKDSFAPWCAGKGYRYLKQLDVKAIIEYRASWDYAPLTALKKFERLRSFLRFCEETGWMAKNRPKR